MNIVTIANRLPVRMGEDGWELSPGGLVTALRPVMAAPSNTLGCWGWCSHGGPLKHLGWLGRWHQGRPGDHARSQRPAAARRAVRQPGAAELPRVRQCVAVAAAARRDREAALRARLVA